MDQNGVEANNSTIIERAVVRMCELRLERCTQDASGKERVEYICGASGGPKHGHILGTVGGDMSSLVAICNTCPIPDALEARQSCLNLVPVRRFSGGKRSLPMVQAQVQSDQTDQSSEQADAYFPCRWSTRFMGRSSHVIPFSVEPVRIGFPAHRARSSPTTGQRHEKCCGSSTVRKSALGPPTRFTPASRTPASNWLQRLFQKVHL